MKIKNIIISPNISIQTALKIMDEINTRLLIVMKGNKFISLLSIGDIQRAIIKNFPLETPVNKIFRKKIRVAYENENFEKIKREMFENRVEYMPILNQRNELIDVIFWKDIFKEKEINNEKLDLPVIIMAGGKGTRLKPLTNIIPKPLLPIDNKTIIEHIIDNFRKIGSKTFYISINYKSNMIKTYFKELEKDFGIYYFEEIKPLGTAGSLHLLKDKINKSFFISNCDILINDDYRKIYKYHKEFKNELTIVASFRHYSIPYGTLETGKNGQLISIKEKPELNFLINSGMYILEPHLINEIPENQFFHITDLIKKIQNRNGRIGVFPVSEKSWIDIGEWDKYLQVIKK